MATDTERTARVVVAASEHAWPRFDAVYVPPRNDRRADVRSEPNESNSTKADEAPPSDRRPT